MTSLSSFILLLTGFAAVMLFSLSSAETITTTEVITRTGEQRKETLTIKNKLATAEGRVSDLISRLDSVSDDASRAKNEIHTTLMEVWKVVDLLGRDQCGEVVDKVRVAQKKAENKAAELQEEIRSHLKDIESLKLQLSKLTDSLDASAKDMAGERNRRESLEGEVRELRDKLQWANAVSNETQKYDEVAKRLQSLLVVVTERNALLERVVAMTTEALAGSNTWRTEIEQLTSITRQTERDFSSVYKVEALESMKRDNTELETRLREARHIRDRIASENDGLLKQIENLKGRTDRKTKTPPPPRTSEPIFVTAQSANWAGWLSFGLMSLITGGFIAMFYGVWRDRSDVVVAPQAPVGGSPEGGDKYGFTPTRMSPGGMPSTSPLTYVNGSGGNRTPASRGSTPRRY